MERDTPDRTQPAAAPGLPRVVMVAVGLTALASLVAVYGFRLESRTALDVLDVFLAAAFGLDLLVHLLRSKDRLAAVRRRALEFGLLGVFGLAVAAVWMAGESPGVSALLESLHVRSVAKLSLALVQVFLVANLVVRLLNAQERFLATTIPAELLLAGSFALLVVTGTALLSLPGAAAAGVEPWSFLDALFTSTSASCVTGLVVRDTGGELSLFGQLVVLTLFQVGGLGIITFVAFSSVLTAKELSVPQAVALRDATSAKTLGGVQRHVRQVLLWVLAIEGVGALSLYLLLPAEGREPLERGYWCVFHAVSAFCNAGFALQRDSLVGLRGAWGPNLVFMSLIVFGGLGMPVARELLAHRLTRAPLFRRFALFKRLHAGRPHRRLTLQTRLALISTAALLLVGFVGFWALEARGSLADASAGSSALAAMFQSVTARTAGFNTVTMGEVSDASVVLLIGLMVIGASPISTGGGIKTVTFAILLITLRSMVTGREEVEVMGRSLPRKVVRAAISLFVLYVMAAGAALFALSITDPDVSMKARTFEAVSALSTVGLSIGETGALSSLGKLVLCALMFVGRVGPLSLTVSVFRSRRYDASYRYPDEDLVVG